MGALASGDNFVRGALEGATRGAVSAAVVWGVQSVATKVSQKEVETPGVEGDVSVDSGGAVSGGRVSVDYSSIRSKKDVQYYRKRLLELKGDSIVDQSSLAEHLRTLDILEVNFSSAARITEDEIIDAVMHIRLREAQNAAAKYGAFSMAPIFSPQVLLNIYGAYDTGSLLWKLKQDGFTQSNIVDVVGEIYGGLLTRGVKGGGAEAEFAADLINTIVTDGVIGNVPWKDD